mmetsp:Transcript_72435/g.127699  ORF Transcript_72435/g.127699 Transcript_72435/m.127699 type:complete len:89 (+) Transcript_72435:957-1223(+)
MLRFQQHTETKCKSQLCVCCKIYLLSTLTSCLALCFWLVGQMKRPHKPRRMRGHDVFNKAVDFDLQGPPKPAPLALEAWDKLAHMDPS